MRIAAAIAAALIPFVPAVEGEAVATEGPGWAAIETVSSISTDREYRITFTSEELRTKYVPYLAKSVAVLRELGVNISIGGVTNVDVADCPAEGVIQFDETYRPLDEAGMSRALPCHDLDDGSSWGGHVQMDSEYWTGWEMPTYMLRNVFPHELMHALGLGHANEDVDGDGEVGAFECRELDGFRPTMCSPNGGYEDERAGIPGPYDQHGIRQMIKNYEESK